MAVYEADHVGFARLMLSDEIGDTVRRRADEIAVEMRVSAPRGRRPRVGPEYASRFTVESGLDVVNEDRRAAFVINDAPYATALEVGSWNIRNPPMPMTRVLQRLGAV